MAGGTLKFCPGCGFTRVCKVLPMVGPKNFYRTDTDLQFFKRKLQCQQCGHGFTTAEIDHKFINELVASRGIIEGNTKLIDSLREEIKHLNEKNDALKTTINLKDGQIDTMEKILTQYETESKDHHVVKSQYRSLTDLFDLLTDERDALVEEIKPLRELKKAMNVINAALNGS